MPPRADARTEARTTDSQDELRIRKEEALRFVAEDAATQAYMRDRGYVYGTDELGYLLDADGVRTPLHISQIIGNTPGAVEAERRAQERIASMWRSGDSTAPSTGVPRTAAPPAAAPIPEVDAQGTVMTDVRAPWKSRDEGVEAWTDASARTERPMADVVVPRRPEAVTPAPPAAPAAVQQSRQTTTRPSAVSRSAPVPSSSQTVRAAAGARIRSRLRERLAALKTKYQQANAGVAEDLNKLSRAHPPSRFAFIVVFVVAVCIDVLNWFLDVTIIGDLIVSVIFFLILRSMINRPKGTQRALALLVVIGVCISILVPIFGILIGLPLICIVLLLGTFNKGVKVHKVNKDKVIKSLKNFAHVIQKARRHAARLIRFGRRTRGLRTVTTRLARSKGFRFFSKGSKTMGRLVGSLIAEAIPFIAWIPFNTINSIWTYSDLKKAHQEAVALLAEYREQEALAISAETAIIQAEGDQSIAALEEAREQEELAQEQAEERALAEQRAATNPAQQQAQAPQASQVTRPVVKDVVAPPRANPNHRVLPAGAVS